MKSNPPLKKTWVEAEGPKSKCVLWDTAVALSWKARPTCEVQSERDEAVVASQELQRFLSLHQSPKVICYRFTIEEVVDANQEVPVAKQKREFVFTFLFYILLFFPPLWIFQCVVAWTHAVRPCIYCHAGSKWRLIETRVPFYVHFSLKCVLLYKKKSLLVLDVCSVGHWV